MSEPTNEEGLIDLLNKCPPDHHIALRPGGESFINVFVVPNSKSDEFSCMDLEGRRQYLRGDFEAVDFHPEIWLAHGLLAMRQIRRQYG